jgi:hypothetical protein
MQLPTTTSLVLVMLACLPACGIRDTPASGASAGLAPRRGDPSAATSPREVLRFDPTSLSNTVRWIGDLHTEILRVDAASRNAFKTKEAENSLNAALRKHQHESVSWQFTVTGVAEDYVHVQAEANAYIQRPFDGENGYSPTIVFKPGRYWGLLVPQQVSQETAVNLKAGDKLLIEGRVFFKDIESRFSVPGIHVGRNQEVYQHTVHIELHEAKVAKGI